MYPQSMFLAKNIKDTCIKFFPMKFSNFAFQKNLFILHGQVFVMIYELPHQKSYNLYMQKQRRRSAVQ